MTTSHLTDETTSHSTKPPKNGGKVAGYNPAKDAGKVIGYSRPDTVLRSIRCGKGGCGCSRARGVHHTAFQPLAGAWPLLAVRPGNAQWLRQAARTRLWYPGLPRLPL